MYKIRPEARLDIVRYYLNNGSTLKKTASKFNVNYRTVFKWAKLYKKDGEARLLRTYKRPWNRTKKGLEEKIALLKEREPTLTIRKAKEKLRKQGITISIKGIWGVWKRYGYAGFVKESLSTDFPSYINENSETKESLKKVEIFMRQEDFYQAAKVLNELPCCSKNKFLINIPDRFLSPKRKLEKFYSLFGKTPYPILTKKLIKLRRNLEERGYFYSALRAGLLESIALAGSGKVDKELAQFAHLREICQEEKLDPALRFSFYCIKGIAHIRNLNVPKSVTFLRKCERLIKKYPTSNFILNLLIFYDNLGYYRKIDHILKLYEKKLDEDNVLFLKSRLYITQGKYRDYRTLIRRLEKKDKKINPLYVLQKAQYLLLEKGDIYKAMNQVQLFLKIVKKTELRIYWSFASFFLAVLYAAQGEGKKAKNFLKKYFPLLKKFGNKKDMLLYEIILGQPELPRYIKKINQIQLFLLLKKASLSRNENDYQKAIQFAKKENLLGILHRVCILLPESIQSLLEKGKDTHLPKAILKLPVFNKNIPVYYIKLLGNLIVYKNQRYLKVNLTPKDTAFLTNFALKAGEPGKRIALEKIYRNFWRDNKNPSRNLSHLLVRTKKALKIPSHLLEVSYRKDYHYLINNGIHFTTDYDEFKQILTQAKALSRAGEWRFSKIEFNRGFKLFRGEPFKKMYDNWSDDKRLEILFSYESEVISFAKELIKRGRTEEAEKLLQEAKEIIPHLNEKDMEI